MKLRLFSLAALALFLHSCSVSTLPRFSPPGSLSTLMQNIKKGMTPEEVAKLAGSQGPYSRNFHQESEEWVYKERFGISYRVYFEGGRVVAFDDGSRVGYYSTPSASVAPSPALSSPNTSGQGRVIIREDQGVIARERAERERAYRSGEAHKWFDNLLGRIRSSFPNERETILRRSLASHYITAEQAAKIVSQFPFADEKWTALKLCIPAMIDFEDLKPLYDLFPFMSDHDKINKWVDQEIEQRISTRQGRGITREDQEMLTRERAERLSGHRSGEGNQWFDKLLDKMSGIHHDREAVLRRSLATRYITAEQAAKIVSQFPFSDEKWRILKLCIPAIVDFEDLKPLYDHFPFSSDREQIDKWVDQEIERRMTARAVVY